MHLPESTCGHTVNNQLTTRIPPVTAMDEREEQPESEAVVLDFDSIVEEHSDFVYNVAYRMMGNAEDAEDVAQEAFISAYRARDRFRGDSKMTTWLYRITTNAALMRLRKEKRSRTLTRTGLEDMDIPSLGETPEGSAITSELGDKIRDGIAMLQPDLRAAVVLRDLSGLSNTEAADSLGITISSLKSRLHRGRILLRKHMSDYIESSRT